MMGAFIVMQLHGELKISEANAEQKLTATGISLYPSELCLPFSGDVATI